jgi:hypothetical protein
VFSQAAVQELADRWRRARRAAVEQVIGRTAEDAAEEERLACAAEVDEAELHRRLFENSARLGGGFRRQLRRAVGVEELPALLSALGAPCLANGTWSMLPGEPGWRFLRRPCCAGEASSARCDAWREAIDGLVLGLTGSLRHTRTASAGHGQEHCVDVIYEDAESPSRYGELPAEVLPALEAVQAFVRRFDGADVRFLGISEGVLLYQLETRGCAGSHAAQPMVEQLLKRKLPGLEVRELSPRQVLDSSHPGERHE